MGGRGSGGGRGGGGAAKKVPTGEGITDKNELINLTNEYEVLSSNEIEGVKHTIVSLNDGYITALKSLNNTNDIESLVPLYVRKSQAEEGR